MHLFIRRARLAGGQSRAAMMWATEITDRVNQVTDLGFTLHAQVFSAEVGELVWATAVPDLATLEKGVEKLQVDDFYMAEQDRGHAFMMSPPSDILQSVVHGEMGEIPIGGYTHAVTSACTAGHISEALTNAVALAEKATAITGATTSVSLSRTGPYAGITWSTSYPGMASLEAAMEATDGDPDWMALVDRMTAGGVFADDPMVSTQSMYRRLH
jgi:hypothetical protein